MKKFALCLLLMFTFCAGFSQTRTDEILAMQYYQSGDYEKAIVLFRKLYAGSRSELFYDRYLSTMFKLKQFDEAEKVIKRQIKSAQGSYNYQVDYGRLMGAMGEAEKANEWFEGLIKNLPKSESSVRDLAANLYRADAFDYAVKAFIAGRRILNDDHAFAYDLIALYRFQKNKTMLIQEYLNVLEQNPESLQQAQGVLGSVLDSNTDYEILKNTLLRRLQKDPQNVAYAEMMSWQYIQQKEFDMALRQSIALDKRLKENGDRIYDLSWLLISNKAYSTAIDGLQYLIDKGSSSQYYVAARIQLLNTKNQMLINGKFAQADLQKLEGEYTALLTEFGKVNSTAFAMRQLANLQAFYLGKPKEAEAMLEQLLQVTNLPANTLGQAKLDLGDIYILTGEIWEANLTYGQVEKQFADEPMGQEAKFRNARLSYFNGDFNWAKAQLDVLKSATSQLIANDALNLNLLITENTDSPNDSTALISYGRADLLIFKNRLPEALSALDSIGAKYPKNSLGDDILMAKAKVYLKQNDFQKATAQLQDIVDNFKFDLWADDALFMLADLYETRLNNTEKAMALYEKLIVDYPGSLFVIEARKRFRNLRGDKIGS